jgi:tRNA nucleotidyltransferase (CCA-adding enzyme)
MAARFIRPLGQLHLRQLSKPTYPIPRKAMDPAITLTAVEANLKRLLLDVALFIENSPTSKESTPLVLRFSGGWVRDKLLKKDSKDIDVTIDKMTGYQFGLKIQEYLNLPGNAKKYNDDPANKRGATAKISKIEANPDKSKHLETATTKVFGLEIDLVNLRKETYTEDSRNPQVEFGTPEEDAMRRDATINAMFYNLNTSSVEDLTGKGLQDLKNGLIRTPLEPVETFTDDPLRVLRLIRFASRFGYDIDNPAQSAMKREEIKKAFMAKITRERVWQEVEKMLKGRDPKNALEYIDSLGLYQVVFVDPVEPEFYIPDLTRWSATYNTLSRIMDQDENESPFRSILLSQREDDYLAWLLSALVPLADAPSKPPAKHGKSPTAYATLVVREGLKASNKASDLASLSVANLSAIMETVQDPSGDRGRLGMTIRGWGPTWRHQVLFAMLHEIFLGLRSEDGTSPLSSNHTP